MTTDGGILFDWSYFYAIQNYPLRLVHVLESGLLALIRLLAFDEKVQRLDVAAQPFGLH
jgi:hypothetical protein